MLEQEIKIYMDVCSLNRPFDNQLQDRIKLESEAVLSILYRCQLGEWNLIGSDIINLEISKMTNQYKMQKILVLYEIASYICKTTNDILIRANDLSNYGIKLFDSLRIACAESYGVSVFITTDDNLIKLAGKSDTQIKISNPVNWILEVTQNEK